MHSGNDKERFKGEKEWNERNKGQGGGIVTHAKGARYDDHSDTARKLMEIEKRRQSEQKNNPGGPRR